MRVNEIITEAVGGNYLYHGMGYRKALDVFYADAMPAKYAHKFPIFGKEKDFDYHQNPARWSNSVYGNSFTRNKRLAWDFVQITVDKNILAQTNKIVPLDGQLVNDYKNRLAFHKSVPNMFKSNVPDGWKYDNQGNRIPISYRKFDYDRGTLGGELSEEFVIGDIKNIHRCIVKIEIIEPKWSRAQKGREEDPLTQERLNRIVRSINAYGQRYQIPVSINYKLQ
jgi:hypothetical protein